MNCYICSGDVIWGNDFDAGDVYPDSEYLIMSNYNCTNCNATYEILHGEKINEME